MLRIDNLCFLYDNSQMVYDFTLEKGGCLALIGPSGGGKTTLLSLIAGFLKPHSGHISFDGMDFTDLAPDQRPLTMLFQEHNLFPHLSVMDNIGIGLHPGLRLTVEHKKRIYEALDNVGLTGMEGRLPKELSGGQRQRVALARSLVRRRPLLLLDEPFSALDPGRRLRMLSLVDQLRKEKGLTILMASHNPEDAIKIADNVAFIDEGKISALAPPTAIFNDPTLSDYLGAIN